MKRSAYVNYGPKRAKWRAYILKKNFKALFDMTYTFVLQKVFKVTVHPVTKHCVGEVRWD